VRAALLDNDPGTIGIAGLACTLDLSGAIYLADERTLLVADLHFEKGSSRARRGFLLPPYDTKATLEALVRVVERYAPRRVVALGDSFHDVHGPDRLGAEERDGLGSLSRGRDWLWITGNHDRSVCASLGGEVADEYDLCGVVLRHEPLSGAAAEMAGHLHPAAKVVLRGRGVRRRCFIEDGTRLILPAFGAYAGGLNVCDPAFAPLFPRGFTAHVIGESRLYRIARAQLCGD
jgi:DNA ligase-associated metallophosphoesterase